MHRPISCRFAPTSRGGGGVAHARCEDNIAGRPSDVVSVKFAFALATYLGLIVWSLSPSVVLSQDLTAEDAYRSGSLDVERPGLDLEDVGQDILPSKLEAKSLASDKGYADGTVPLSNLFEVGRQYGRTDVGVLPVDMVSQVNYWDARDSAIYIQDRHGGSYVSATPAVFGIHPKVKPGTKVRLVGQLVLNGHFLRCDEIEILQELPPFPPHQVQLDELELGTFWSDRVVTSGKVVEVARYGERWLALLESNGVSFALQRYDRDSAFDWPGFIGRQVRIEGTLSCDLDFNSVPYRYRICTTEFDPPLELVAPSEAFQSPATRDAVSVEQLRSEAAGSDQVYRLSGQVTSVDPGKGFLISFNGKEIYLKSAIAAVENQSHVVDVLLQLTEEKQFECICLQAGEQQGIAAPQRTLADDVIIEHLPFRAQLQGELVSYSSEGLLRKLILRDGETVFDVEFFAEDETWLLMSLDTAREISAVGMLSILEDAPGNDSFSPAAQFVLKASGVEAIEVKSRDWQLSRQSVVTTLSIVASVFALGMLCFGILWFRVRRADRRNKELSAQLIESQKMDALGRLASGVAHDFNNLLTGISSNLQLVEASASFDSSAGRSEEQANCLASAQRCTRQASKLVRSLLGFARQADLELKTGDVNCAIDDVATMLRSSVGPDIQIQLRLQSDLPSCRFDYAQMEQVLLNLCFNARDAIHNASYKQACSIRLETEGIQIEGQKEFIQIRVMDDGEGMDQEVRERIFEPFFTTKPVGRGTGLGLPMAYGVISQHGGTLKCISEKGIGTRFEINLPVAVPGESIASSAGPSKVSLGGVPKEKRVLVVDDNAEVLRVAKLSLEALGYDAFAVPGGRQALELLAIDHDFDVVILDLQMPEISGLETYRHIRDLRPELPVIVCSGHVVDLHRLRDSSGHPPNGCLEKPFELADLSSTLDAVLVSSNLSLAEK